jgi:hypothetical protein
MSQAITLIDDSVVVVGLWNMMEVYIRQRHPGECLSVSQLVKIDYVVVGMVQRHPGECLSVSQLVQIDYVVVGVMVVVVVQILYYAQLKVTISVATMKVTTKRTS